MIIALFTYTGRLSLLLMACFGKFLHFAGKVVYYGVLPPYYVQALKARIFEIGYLSLPVVGLTALFTGMVLALQSYTGFSRFEAEDAIAGVVALSITRELGPVLTGLMIAGRLGSSMAAEIGTMRVTQQIDALITLSKNPFRYLFWPRLLASVLTMPLLVIVADIIGVLGGYLVAIYELGFTEGAYLNQTFDILKMIDVISGLIKAFFFGMIIALTGCYQGYYTEGGAAGVGLSSTKAVVQSSIAILVMNYVLTSMFFRT